ncbi:PAS domain S-box protein [Chitinimonas sp. BJB300]|uniref:PAS domain S-box protein n=1 Tax=Chitinimonas sp. BJB300 TaxID=1559339 RepID=UPI0013046BAA|nr:PAS domain S-box protein [Chitinimonas sp. BJB300]
MGTRLYLDKQAAEAESAARLQNQARVIAQNLDAQLHTTDNLLRDLTTELSRVHGVANWSQVNVYLRALAHAQPGLRHISVLDREGVVRASSNAQLMGKNFADYDYFSVPLRQSNPRLLYVSPPFRTNSDNSYALSLSRIVLGERGQFDGIVMTTLDRNYFKTLMSSVLFAPNMWSAIAHGDGLLFLVMPNKESQLGQNLSAQASFFSSHRDSRQQESLMVDRKAGEQRQVAQYTVSPPDLQMNKPLVVAVSQLQSATLAPWYNSFRSQVLLYLLLAFLMLVGFALLQSRRRQFSHLKANHRRILDIANEGVISFDAEGRITYMNAAAAKLTGWNQKSIEVENLFARLDQAGQPELAQLLSPPTYKGEIRELSDTWLPVATGERLSVSLSCTANREAAHTYSWVMVFRDIGAQKQAAQILRESEARLKLATEAAGVAVWEYDLVTGETKWDESVSRLYGLPLDPIYCTYASWQKLVEPEDIAAVEATLQAAIAERQPFHATFRVGRYSDGQQLIIQAHGQLILNEQGQPVLMVGTNEDITEEREAANQLRDAEERFRSSFDGASIGMALVNREGQFIQTNQALLDIVDYSEEELRHLTFQAITHPDDLPTNQALLLDLIQGKCSNYHLETRYRCKSGETVWIQQSASVVRDYTGKLLYFVVQIQDINMQKLAMEQVRRERDLFADGPVLVRIWQPAEGWPIEYVSRNSETVLGYAADEITGSDFGFATLLHPEEAVRVQAAITQFVAGDQHHIELSYRLLCKDGTYRWFYDFNTVDRDTSGQLLALRGYMLDQTSIKDIEQALAAERERLSAILSGTSAGTWEWHVPTGEVVINKYWAEMLGYEIHELAPVNIDTCQALVHPDDLILAQEQLDLYFNGIQPDYECEIRMRHKNGAWVWILARGKVNRWTDIAQPLLMSGTHKDITKRKQAEEDLRSTSGLLRSVLDSATEVSIIATNPEGLITIFNRGAERMLGYCADEMIGVRTPLCLHLPEEIAKRRLQLETELGTRISEFATITGKADRDGVEQLDWTYVRKDGSRLTMTLIVTAIRSFNNDLLGYLGIGRDVTQAREYESTLKEAKQQAELASTTKSQFLANMSHEIRTPMNAILGMVQVLQRTELTVRQQDYAGKALSAAQSLLGILNDILDFSKVEASKMLLETQPFRPDKLMRDLSVILSAGASSNDVEMLFSIDPKLPPVLMGDALRLKQVLINLAGNAVKFTQHGEVLVALDCLSLHENQAEILFTIKDSGIGIAADALQHIFEVFTQAEASTTRRFGGTGLGLAISQRLVKLMGGKLAVESTPGVGSRFYFTLKLTVGKTISETLLPATHSFPLNESGMRTLIVDDNPIAREVLSDMVHALGWQADTAASGREALALLQQSDTGRFPYDVVFMDWKMPDMDGWETTRHIRLLQNGVHTPTVILVSAHDREILADKIQHHPNTLDGFLTKPVTASMLLDAVVNATAGQVHLQPSGNQSVLNRLQGLRLLVVEDNLLNQQVAQELLSAEGAYVEVASGGVAGVARATNAVPPFDAVLMDIQMPDIDGYTATREIRRHPAMAWLSIIAMTANAMASDKATCLAAGMNDHIGKPIHLDSLVSTLLHHCGRTKSTADSAGIAIQNNASINTLIAELDIELDIALQRLSGNQELFARMIHSFSQDAAAMVNELQAHLQQATLVEASRLLHTLKGLAGTVGAKGLAIYIAQAEQQLRHPRDAAANAEMIATLTDMIENNSRVLTQIAEELAPQLPLPPSAANQDLDKAAFEASLSELESFLKDGNMRATDIFCELQQAFGPILTEHLQPLDEAMYRLDFKLALEKCCNLRSVIA